jgi:hypothetical protein
VSVRGVGHHRKPEVGKLNKSTVIDEDVLLDNDQACCLMSLAVTHILQVPVHYTLGVQILHRLCDIPHLYSTCYIRSKV